MQYKYEVMQDTFVRNMLRIGYTPSRYTKKSFYVGFHVLVSEKEVNKVLAHAGVQCDKMVLKDGTAIFPAFCISSLEIQNISVKYGLGAGSNGHTTIL